MTSLWRIIGEPPVVDLSHNNPDPIDFAALKAAGIKLVIHKATQGTRFVDPCYADRRKAALAAGLKWDAYHFVDDDDLALQMIHFISTAKPDDTMRLALDIEPNGGSTASFSQANDLAGRLDQRMGRQCWRYTGLGYLTPAAINDTPVFRSGPIWFAKYGPQPRAEQLAGVGIDPGNILLWQETESGSLPGIDGHVDQSYWLGPEGSLDAYPVLPAFGGLPRPIPAPAPSPAHLSRLLREGMRGDDVKDLQQRLTLAGFPCGTADGVFGIATASAVVRFQTAHRLVADAAVGNLTWQALLLLSTAS
jgi:lysozyme